MSDPDNEKSMPKRLVRRAGDVWRRTADVWQMSDAYVRNWRRRLRHASLDYVLMPVAGSLPERARPQPKILGRRLPGWPKQPLSMEYLNGRLQLIGDADNVKGVLFIFQGLDAGLATIQNFRASLQRLREAGKESIVFTPYLDLRHYYAASAADRIYAPPGATFNTLGLHADVAFLKDALQQIGVQVDVVQISPYKTAFDALQHEAMTPQFREQLDWLLDDTFDMLTAEMAQSRKLEQDTLISLIDQAPHFAEEAVRLGLIDGVVYEDELAPMLAGSEPEPPARENGGAPPETGENGRPQQAKIKSWPQAFPLLLEKPRRRPNRFVGVISVEGVISMGPSRRPPIDLPIPLLGGATAGAQTLVDLLRRAEKLERMAALVLYVDSRGGSALASELIGREVRRIARKTPVLAYMGNVAASGGYYVSAPAQHVMCQPATTTGSIGVIAARPTTRDLYGKLMINRVTLQRGRHANLYSDAAPMTAEERRIFMAEIEHSYTQFKEVVAQGRSLELESLDPVCEGRVWTGNQARARKLVDSHGDFVAALRTAAQLGGLPVDGEHAIPVANLAPGGDGYRLPRPFAEAQEASRLISGDWLAEMSGRPLWLMPFLLKIR